MFEIFEFSAFHFEQIRSPLSLSLAAPVVSLSRVFLDLIVAAKVLLSVSVSLIFFLTVVLILMREKSIAFRECGKMNLISAFDIMLKLVGKQMGGKS